MRGFARHIFEQLVVNRPNPAADVQQRGILQPQRTDGFENQFRVSRKITFPIRSMLAK